MKSQIIIRSLLSLIIPLSFIVACELDVPIKEMSLAKITITRAKEVKADKYAPAELKKAKEHLYKSHEDLKKEEEKDAKKNGELALKYANEAVNKSLPLLSKDTLDEAKKLLKEADLLYAEKFASSEFNKAGTMVKDAEKLHSNSSYWNSYIKSKDAIKIASTAKDKASAKMPDLKNQIEKIKTEANDLKSKRGSEFASGDLSTVNSKLSDASKQIEKKDLKTASKRIEDAKDYLNRAKQRTQKGIAAEKLKEAKNSLAKAKESKIKDNFTEDLKKASSLISESQQLYGNGSYKGSIAKSEQAIDTLKTARSSMVQKYEELKKTAADKIEAAENSLKKINESEFSGNYKDDIARVIPIIANSKGLYQQESYQDSIESSDKALEILNSIIIAMEKKGEEKRLSKDKVAGKEYVVKLNRKKRDCLWRIAFRMYRNAKLWPLIYMANKNQIKDPDLIFPGQKFVIPPVEKKGKKEEVKDKDKKEEEKE